MFEKSQSKLSNTLWLVFIPAFCHGWTGSVYWEEALLRCPEIIQIRPQCAGMTPLQREHGSHTQSFCCLSISFPLLVKFLNILNEQFLRFEPGTGFDESHEIFAPVRFSWIALFRAAGFSASSKNSPDFYAFQYFAAVPCTKQRARAWWALVRPGEPWWGLVSPGEPWWALVRPGEPWWALVRPGEPWWALVRPGEACGVGSGGFLQEAHS